MKILSTINESDGSWKAIIYILRVSDDIHFDLDYKSAKKSGLDIMGKVIVKTNATWPTSGDAEKHVIDCARNALMEKGIINVYDRFIH